MTHPYVGATSIATRREDPNRRSRIMTIQDPYDHQRHVDAWLAAQRGSASGVSRGPPGERLGLVLLVGLRALWDRARPVLGDVTLGAIFRRALDAAQRRHPELSALGVRITDRGTVEMSNQAAPRVDLTGGITFLLVELLRVVARLSAGALTQPLHIALADASVDDERWRDATSSTPPSREAELTER